MNLLKAYQDFLEIDNQKILSPGQTRWLSVHSCVKRILEQWDALILYFTEAVFDDPTHGKYLALGGLKNPFMRIMMMFLDYILAMLADFNPLFQSQSPLFHTFKLKHKDLLQLSPRTFLR